MLMLNEKLFNMADSMDADLHKLGYPTDITFVYGNWLKNYGADYDIVGFNESIFYSEARDYQDLKEEHDIKFARHISSAKGNVFIGLFKTGTFTNPRLYLLCWKKVGRKYIQMFQIGWKNGSLLKMDKNSNDYLEMPLSELIEGWTFNEKEYESNYGWIIMYSIHVPEGYFAQSMNWSRIPLQLLGRLL